MMDEWWVMGYLQTERHLELVAWIFWILFSVTLHELGHGYAAIWQGDRTPIEMNRMTMSPFVHMGPMSLIFFALIGIAWGQMPISPHRFRDGSRGDMMVSAAGPAVNLLLAIATTLLLVLWLWIVPQSHQMYAYGGIFLFYGGFLNLFLAFFNLIPIPPFDGGHILIARSAWYRNLFRNDEAHTIAAAVVLVIFFMSPVGAYLWIPALSAVTWTADTLGGPLGNPPVDAVRFADMLHLSIEDATRVFDGNLDEVLFELPEH